MSGSLDALTARIDNLIEKRAAKLEPFRATVKAVGTGLVTIRRPEASADDDEEYARVAGFTLQVNDEVLCLPTSGKPVVIGRLQRAAITDLDVNVRNITITGTQTGGGAFSALGSNGIVVQTAVTPTFAARTIASGTNIAVTNPDGVSGNPSIATSLTPTFTTVDTNSGNVTITSDGTSRPKFKGVGDSSIGSGAITGFELYKGASVAARMNLDAGGTVDLEALYTGSGYPDFRIVAPTQGVVKIIPNPAGEAFRFAADTASTGAYGYLVFYQAKANNTAGARLQQVGAPGLAIEADTGFVKIGAGSAVPVTISQSGQTTTVGGALAVNGNTTLGDASGDTVTVNAGTVTIPANALNVSAINDATVQALAAYNTNGLVTQTAADTFTGRTITGTANQIAVSNGDGVAGNPTIALASTVVQALATYNTNGLVTQTAADTFTGRTITGTANQIAVSNGDGVAGNPTIALASTVDVAGKLTAQTGRAIAIVDSARTTTTTFTSTTEASQVTGGSYALTAGSIVRAKVWGFYGNTSGTATLTIQLRQSTTDVVSIVLPTVSAQTNSTANPYLVEFESTVLTTTTATGYGRASSVNNADADGDANINRVKLSANPVTISSASTAWNISFDWSTTTGTPTATIMGGYIEFAIV